MRSYLKRSRAVYASTGYEGSDRRTPSPVTYPSSIVPAQWRWLYGLNPMAGVIEGFRWALLGTDTAPGPLTVASVVAAFLLLVSGAFYFRRMEKTFADVV